MEKNEITGGHWWDKLGKPEYGGEFVFRLNRKIVNFDPYFGHHLTQIHTGYMERLHAADWTRDLTAVSHDKRELATRGKGHLAETWEFTDPHTYVVHLHKDIRWQDIPPANGREFTADDVVFHFHRLYGLGSGYTQPSQAREAVAAMKELVSVTAADRYTVVFKWRTSNQSLIIESMEELGTYQCIENPEAVRKWGDLRDWHHAVGTGPFILKEFVPDVSATFIKNPHYWGHDERYPQNKLPYVDGMKLLIIPDQEKTLAEMRAGRIDAADQISPMLAQELKRTNPEILQIFLTANTAVTIDPRNDRPPFNGIRVRKAMQLAIDLPGIAKNYYKGSVEPYPSSLTAREMKGWGFPYEEWPQDLKDEYTYNPGLARKLLADAGYPHGFKTNIVADDTGDMELLEVIKAYFADVGIDMEIRPMDSTEWIAYVLNGHKHDQLAQRPISPYGHRHDPVRQMGRLRAGSASNYLMINDAVLNAFQPAAIAATSEDQVKKLLRDTNEHIARQHFAISLLSPGSYTLYQPWLKGFNGQFGAFCSAAGSPQMLFFYPARFWIDHTLKKAMKAPSP
jgi:peptide/nickel transport system substrate-binding protein